MQRLVYLAFMPQLLKIGNATNVLLAQHVIWRGYSAPRNARRERIGPQMMKMATIAFHAVKVLGRRIGS